jgi:putative membrane protein
MAQSVTERAASGLGITPSTESFAKNVAISDMFEIESSKLAEDKGSAPIKSFASNMVGEHSKTTSELKALVSSGKVKVELPAAMDSSHQSKVDKLKGLNGNDFNASYKDEQVAAHKNAVSMFERYAKGGDNPSLKSWAKKTLPALKHHLSMAQKLKS